MLGQQVFKVGIADILSITNIANIATGIANIIIDIAGIADRVL